jgi:flagellar hook-length control protein FliK
MLGRQEQKIEMQLNPPNLGPMEVRLNLAQDQASVVFSSQNAAVREALAAAMPKLTTLLADQGFTLTNVQVASDSLQQHQQQQHQNQQAATGSGFNQQNSNRNLGGVYGAQVGIDGEKMQELGPLRLPVAKGGLSLFV